MRNLLLAALLGALLTHLAPAQVTNAAPSTNAAPAAPAAPVSDVISDADIVSRAQTILDKYQQPTSPPEPDQVESGLRASMATVESRLPLFTQSALQIARGSTVENITTLEKWGDDFATTIGTKVGSTNGWQQIVSKHLDELKDRITDLDVQRKIWDDTAAALKKESQPAPEYLQQITAVQARLQAVRADVVTRRQRLLQLQVQILADGTQVKQALTALKSARAEAITRLFQLNAPPVWQTAPLPQATEESLSWLKQVRTLQLYAGTEPGRFLAHALLLVVLIALFWWLRGYTRRLAQEEPGITPAAGIFETPISTALLLSLGASPLLYYPIAPRLLYAVLGAASLIPCVILLRRLIEPRLFPILYALVAFFLVEEIRSVASMPAAGARALLLAEMLGVLCFLGWLLLRLGRADKIERFGRVVRAGGRVAFALLSAGWLAEVLGFTLLANLVVVTVQHAATLALALYAGIRVIDALLFIGVRLPPLSGLGMVKSNAPMLLQRAQRMLVWTASIIWALSIFEALPWSSDANAHIFSFLARYNDQGDLVLRWQGRILVAVLIGWGAFQLSRLVRFILETDFYPRLHLGAGVPYAISTFIHYVFLTVAFIAATAVLGIDMSKFTILVSALGVGVGFGLQNIINNFVSGLILLFERPVKIGDTILTGTDTGTVERIGIRASVLRTPAGTEVIVPNGTLISNNVTNWTLSSRERIILIPVSVPRGQDMAHVISVLTTAAAAHSVVLKRPAPEVLAQALGPNLGLELRAWIGPEANWTQVRSEVVLAVNAALAKENITLA